MPFLIISVLLQVALVIHVVKTGRSTNWIWIVLMLPLAGAIAYILLEVIPDASNTRAGREAGKKVNSILNPNKDMNQAVRDYAMSETVENTLRLAQECLNKSMFKEAKELYEKALASGSDDPELAVGLARAEFGLEDYQAVKKVLDDLIVSNPDYKNPDAHLLYARSLEKLAETDAALHEYEVLHEYFSGPEATFYYACCLADLGEEEKAMALFEQIVKDSELSGRHYQSLYKDIIKQAKQRLSNSV